MNRATVAAAFGSAAAALLLAACSSRPSGSSDRAPADVIEPHGTDLGGVVLAPGAADTLGLQTEPIRDATRIGADPGHETAPRVLVPLSAVIYDIDGTTSVYVNTEPDTYVRVKVTVVEIEGDNAVISGGPQTGASIVTVGGVELLGAQKGVPGEQ
jgi:multidrug efflux pump subunit AcrA (membrane-fusion protein)